MLLGICPRSCRGAAPRTPVTIIVRPVRSGICSLFQVMALIHSFTVSPTVVMLLASINQVSCNCFCCGCLACNRLACGGEEDCACVVVQTTTWNHHASKELSGQVDVGCTQGWYGWFTPGRPRRLQTMLCVMVCVSGSQHEEREAANAVAEKAGQHFSDACLACT